ncbi:ion transporter [Kiloniella spongiae]|uniref:Ion transporter n=1 Tax=Kiloniella spongiae TaxID=1489064 RepID=A0A0H2N186_9PROT|nr:ion transporter [Kiloniella spongiae]
MRVVLEGNTFTWVITILILINAVTLGLETNSSLTPFQTELLHWVDKIILVIFSLELALKFYTYRLGFFKSGWNIFDLLIVTIAWVPASGALAVLRALRILRVLRLISVIPQMRRVIGAIVASIPGMLSVVGVLSIVFYVAAVLTTKLFGQHPDPNMQEWFGSVSSSAYTLFQIMTLESWSMGIVRPTMEIFPHSWIFFIPFIIITSFAVLNLFIGIIVDAMQTSHESDTDEKITEMANITHDDLQTLINRFDVLENKIDQLSDSDTQPSTKS